MAVCDASNCGRDSTERILCRNQLRSRTGGSASAAFAATNKATRAIHSIAVCLNIVSPS